MTRPTETPDIPPPWEITPGQMFAAFGMARTTFMRRMLAGNTSIPQPQGRAGVQRRWTAEQLPEIVAALKRRRRPVPPGWDVGAVGTKASGKGKTK